ncbi:MAG: alpha/beta hydrolase, partial [Xanthomonadaceae bacterium]|nr:alpha/beta hydrolase [Xanthomonadaceae bacterium]
DTKNAIRWMRQHAAEFHMDPSRTVIWGPSAGGQIASLVGTSCGVAALEPPAPPQSAAALPSDCVQGVIDWYGVTDLLHVASDAGRKPAAAPAPMPLSTILPPLASPEVAYLGCAMADCPKDYLAASSPITWVDPKDPPFLIQHGGKDATVNLRQAQRLTDALKAAGVAVELVVYPNQDHSFANPTGPRRNDRINQQALDKVYAFLERTLGASR